MIQMQSGTELNVMGGYYCVPKVEVVIKIPQDDLQILRHKYSKGAYRASTIEQALVETILNGTVLPKGHGRLIDVENAKTKLCRVADRVPEPSKSCYIMSALYLENTDEFPTVIEADKEANDE